MVNIRIKVGIGGKIINVDKDLLESILGSSAGDVIPDVVKTHEKFANPHLSYPEARLWDALARMLVGLKPCCALYPEFVGGNIVRIKVAFNDSIFEPGQAAVTSIKCTHSLGPLFLILSDLFSQYFRILLFNSSSKFRFSIN